MRTKLSLIKILFLISISSLIIVCGAFFILTILVNPNDYKSIITEQLEDISGRKSSIKGDIKWTLFPHFGIKINQISLANPTGFPSTDFINLDTVELSLKPAALIHGIIAVNSIQFTGLYLDLIEVGNKNNWTFKTNTPSHPGVPISGSPLKWQLHALKLGNTYISYQNLDKHITHKPESFNFELTANAENEINFESQQLAFTNTEINYNNNIKGYLSLILNFDTLKFNGELNLQPFSLNTVLNQLHIANPAFPNKQILNRIAIATLFNGNANALKLESINISTEISHLSGNVDLHTLKPLTATENLTIDILDLSDYIDLNGFKVPMKDIHIYGALTSKSLEQSTFIPNLNATQYLTIQNITLLGLNVKSISTKLSQVSGDVIDVGHAVKTFNDTQAEMNRLKQPNQHKNLNQSTNLGSLNAKIIIHNGILSTPECKLSGPILISNGKGTINLQQKTLNYTLYTQLYAPQDSLVSHLTFPYHMYGKLNNFNGSVDSNNVQSQIITYYTDGVTGTVSNVGHNVAKDTKGAINSSTTFIKNLFK